jgi:hypothetical protein
MAAFFGQNEGYKWFTSEYPLAIDALWTETVVKSDRTNPLRNLDQHLVPYF